jgi:glycosyltransferase involved in cell wall biosynthesis
MIESLTVAMTDDERVSAVRDQLTIIIPAFRCAGYLPTAVASALHTPGCRILIADDGSGPAALEVARQLEAEHRDRIRVLASPVTRGVAMNMNEAAEQVKTKFFAKLDGDDVLIPGYLERVFPIIAARPRLAVLAGHELRIAADEVTKFVPELLPNGRRNARVQVMEGPEAYRFIVNWNPNPTSSGVIYRTEAFRDVGGYDQRIEWGEDWEIWLRFAKKWEVAYITAPAALYRIHEQSATATATRQNRLCYAYDAMFRRAAELCDYPEVIPIIRRRMFEVAKLYAAAAARRLRGPGGDSLDCCRNVARALWLAVGAAGAGRARASTATRLQAVAHASRMNLIPEDRPPGA